MNQLNLDKEKNIEKFLRKHSWVLYSLTFLFAAALYAGIYGCMLLFHQGYYWALVPSGLLAHSFFVITMHDGAHKSITRTKLDYWIMNICSGLIVLPLYTELFKKYHLLHHAHTNTENDPLWTPQKERLFSENRLLYAFLQCLPFAFNFYIIFYSFNQKKKGSVKAVKPDIFQILLSFAVAAAVIILVQPGIWFVLGTFTIMTSLGAVRYWGEHMGVSKDKESNTHWFPIGMGIGNHEVHHHKPGYSWLTLTIGLFYRKMDIGRAHV